MPPNQAVYGIIGYPVAHSLSPSMHNAAFKELKADCVYKLFPLKEEELDSFFEKLRAKDCPIFGLNVTVPYKEKAMKYLDSLSPFLQKVMAVNTIVVSKNRRLVGYNTDAPGFLAHLTELKFDPKGKNIVLLGAGGSARAVMAALCLLPERPASIKIYNRTLERAKELMADLKTRLDTKIAQVVMSIDDLDILKADLLINATSIGLKEDDEPLIEEELLHEGMLVYDLIYNPKETKLLRMAKEKGARTANGLGMLFYQGILSLQHWASLPLGEEVKKKMREALERPQGTV